MNVTKAQLADLFEVSTRTITTWQSQGMPVVAGEGNGGKGGENTYSTKDVITWYADREASLENEILRKDLDALQQSGDEALQPGTIDYERYRLTRAQADGQELKNAKDSAEVVETGFCMFVLSKVAGRLPAF